MNRRLRPFLLPAVGAFLWLLTSGCPLDIRARCDEVNVCAQGQACDEGACVPIDGMWVGSGCIFADDCGPGYVCNRSWLGGYCTLECSQSVPCPGGSVCAVNLGVCFKSCDLGCDRLNQECMQIPGESVPLRACMPTWECEGSACPDAGADAGMDGGTDGGCTGASCGDGGVDGGCTGGACQDGGSDGGCSGAGCQDGGSDGGGSDGGCSGTGCQDGGTEVCGGTVELGGSCSRACECKTPGAGCDGRVCTLTCSTDFQCPVGRRCRQSQCEVGPRLGEGCTSSLECTTVANCHPTRRRCEESCNPQAGGGICLSEGYRCASDSVCVEACSDAPTTVGRTCENSLDCARCGECLPSDQGLRCRQLCARDSDCPGGAAGACEVVGRARACRL
ncbi:hypothetical protein LZ198_19350 [Myxococcus sp. K15C18031901]|uniref:hypothetical protein n=1 Tax=Myxococcus dinghuensis TaxID=2906761 RepID=UPI0020A75A76|nr:hypothetical protein [Myxococcus dinghuensis]MCP3101035.1 hypothetical protein [Myxococcus dinghuensis]